MSALTASLCVIALFAGAFVGRVACLVGRDIERYFARGEERRALEEKWTPHE